MQGQGKCLCGAVTVSVEKLSEKVGVCHCTMCRKWSGGPWLALECNGAVSWEGEENIATYHSSDWADRGFCKKCGTHLFYKLKAVHSQYFMPVGLFDQEARYRLDHQIFIDEKPEFYNFSEKTQDMTGAEVFAKFSKE